MISYLHDGLAEETSAPDHVLGEQLPHDDGDVGRVDLVDQTVDRLLESFPGKALETNKSEKTSE